MIQLLYLCFFYICFFLNNSSSSTLCKENSNCQSFSGSDKENLYVPIIYHIFLPTVGRSFIFLQLQSLLKQLISSDILTIVFDGKLNTGGNKQELEINNFIKLFKCKVNIIIEENNRGYWSNGIRNLYKHDLIGDYIWFIDDDDVVTFNSMDIIRNICKDRSKNIMYLFNTITNGESTYWEKDQLLHYRTAHSFQAIIPMNAAKKSIFGLQQDGDRLFFNNIKQYLNSIQFINETIYLYNKEVSYTIINHYFNIANENLLSIASRDDWIKDEKESSNLDNILYRELVVKTCSELNLRLKNLHFHNCAKYAIKSLKSSYHINKFNDLNFYYHPLSKDTLQKIIINEINFRSNNILINNNYYNALTSNSHIYNLEMIDIRRNNYWQTIANTYIISNSNNDINFQLFEKRWKIYGLSYYNTYRIVTKINHNFKTLNGVEGNINNIIDILKSHITAISHFVNSDKQFSMILNDNFSFIEANNVNDIIINIFNYFGDILNVLYLVNSKDNNNQRMNICSLIFQNKIDLCEYFKNNTISKVNKLFPLSSIDSSAGYILSKSYAMKLLRKYVKILTYLDFLSYLDNDFIEDYYLNIYDDDDDDEKSKFKNTNITILLPIGKLGFNYFDKVIDKDEKKYNFFCSNNSMKIVTSFNSLSETFNSNKIVSIDIRGGLGNQLFMIFATLSFAYQNNFHYNLIRHSSSFNNNSVNFWNNFLSQISYSNKTLTKFYNYHYENDPFLFDKIPVTSNKIYLMGYFQNEEYFYSIKDIILSFLLCGLSIEDKLLIEKIIREIDLFAKGRVKIFVHIRRGDYLLYPNHHNIISENYYRNSISILNDKVSKLLNNDIIQNNTNNSVKNEVLYIFFSDDTEYAKNTFKDLGNNFFSIDNGYPDYIILIIMSLLDGGIIANSSFSWWGAYLQNLQKNNKISSIYDKISSIINKEILIIAPKFWFFKNSTVHTPKEWILVD